MPRAEGAAGPPEPCASLPQPRPLLGFTLVSVEVSCSSLLEKSKAEGPLSFIIHFASEAQGDRSHDPGELCIPSRSALPKQRSCFPPRSIAQWSIVSIKGNGINS